MDEGDAPDVFFEAFDFMGHVILPGEPSRIEEDEEGTVGKGDGRIGVGARTSRESAGEHFDHEGESEAFVGLVSSHGEDGAGGIAVEDVGIGGGVAIGVEDPAWGDGFSRDFFDADFPLGGGAGSEVEDEGTLFSAGDSHAKGVGSDARAFSTDGGDALAGPVSVGANDGDEAFGGGHFRVFPESADVGGPLESAAGDPDFPGLGDQSANEVLRDDLAQSPLSVPDERAGGFVFDMKDRGGLDAAVLDPLDIGGDAHDAVGVVASKVGFNEAVGDDSGMIGGDATRHEKSVGEVGQEGGGDGWHGGVPDE